MADVRWRLAAVGRLANCFQRFIVLLLMYYFKLADILLLFFVRTKFWNWIRVSGLIVAFALPIFRFCNVFNHFTDVLSAKQILPT
jgi:hypothetical protein